MNPLKEIAAETSMAGEITVDTEGVDLRCSTDSEIKEVEQCICPSIVYTESELDCPLEEEINTESATVEGLKEDSFSQTLNFNGSGNSLMKSKAEIGKAFREDSKSQTVRKPHGTVKTGFGEYGAAVNIFQSVLCNPWMILVAFCWFVNLCVAVPIADLANPCRGMKDLKYDKPEILRHGDNHSFVCSPPSENGIKLCADEIQVYSGYDENIPSWLHVGRYLSAYNFTITEGPKTPRRFACLNAGSNNFSNLLMIENKAQEDVTTGTGGSSRNTPTWWMAVILLLCVAVAGK